jgi:hypothetical protein
LEARDRPRITSSSSSSDEEEDVISEFKVRVVNTRRNGRPAAASNINNRTSENDIKNNNSSTATSNDGKLPKPRSFRSNVFNFDEKSLNKNNLSSNDIKGLRGPARSFEFRKLSEKDMRSTSDTINISKNSNSQDEITTAKKPLSNDDSGFKQLFEKRNNTASSTSSSSALAEDYFASIHSLNPHGSSKKKDAHIITNGIISATAATTAKTPAKKNLKDLLDNAAVENNNNNNTIMKNSKEEKEMEEEEFDENDNRDYYIQLIVKKERTPQEIRMMLEERGKSKNYIQEILSEADEVTYQSDIFLNDGENGASKSPTLEKKAAAPVVESEESRDARIFENLNNLLTTNKPVFEKYIKMKKLGVMPANIIQKMTLDGVDGKFIKEFEKALLLNKDESGANNNNKKKELSSNELLLTSDWKSLTNNDRLKNSIWAFTSQPTSSSSFAPSSSRKPANGHHNNKEEHEEKEQEGKSENISSEGLLAEKELKELEEMFLKNQKQVSSSSSSQDANNEDDPETLKRKKIQSLMEKSSKASQFKLHILEGKRAQNIIIGLVPFKQLLSNSGSSSSSSSSSSTQQSHLQIIKSICGLNTMNHLLTVDHLENFKYLLPTESELKLSYKLKEMKKEEISHPAEVFFQGVIFFYPELPIRLNAFITCLSLEMVIANLDQRIKMMMNMINQVSFLSFLSFLFLVLFYFII